MNHFHLPTHERQCSTLINESIKSDSKLILHAMEI